jgi:hypothetical protein
MTKKQQNRPAIASTLVAPSGVNDKSHLMSSAHVDIQINEDK